MKLGIGLKLGLLLAFFGSMAAGLTGYYSFNESRDLLVKAAQKEMLTSTQVLGRRFSILMNETARNVRLLATLPSAQGVFGDDMPADARQRSEDRLAAVFESMLKLHPEYFQVRLIGATDHGRERVRVDRTEHGFSQVTGEHLQEKAQYPYVYETLRLAPGQFYLSPVFVNHETGVHLGIDKPTVLVATPVTNADGVKQGLIVINMDLNGLFNLLKSNLPSDILLYLTNANGDFLIHPDRHREFGFDHGRHYLIQDAYRPIRNLLFGSVHSEVFSVTAADALEQMLPVQSRNNGGLAATFVKLSYGELAPDRFVVLGLARPLEAVFEGTRQLGKSIVNISVGFSLLALLLSMVVSRAVSRPLKTMAKAVKRFSQEHVSGGGLPVERADEIGQLARSFSEMETLLGQHLDTLHQKEVHLHHLAQHDTLTNLPNRMLLTDRLSHAIVKANRHGNVVAVIFIDLDRFKDINDSLGHAVGDQVIKQVGAKLKSMVRDEDTVARLGGDEFIVVLEQVDDPATVATIAGKLLQGVQKVLRVGDRDLSVSASMGISLFPQDGDDPQTLIRNADAAMYRSKDQGRNTFHFYTEDMTEKAFSRVQLEAQLRQALEREEFCLEYQCKVDLNTGATTGLEALVRWHKDKTTLLMPGYFIALAEDTGLIEPIGEWVLREACRQMREWRDAGYDPGRVAVNISAKQLRRKEVINTIIDILEETDCEPSWLELEITESFLIERPQESRFLLQSMRALGIEVSIDDFGTGYSSLSYLKHLPLSKLKIDRSFVSNLPQDADDMAITRAIIALAKSLGMRVIAEGVEQEQQRDVLQAEGCDEAQGFLFGRPVSADKAVAWFAASDCVQ